MEPLTIDGTTICWQHIMKTIAINISAVGSRSFQGRWSWRKALAKVQGRVARLLSTVIVLVGAQLLVACGGGAADPPVAAQAARIQIAPGALLMTRAGEVQSFTAVVYDAQGNDMKGAPIQWSSSKPGVVAIGADGRAMATAAVGSSLITAQSGDARAVTTVIVAEPVPGAMLVRDDQIVRAQVSDPAAPWGVGFRYTGTLQGVVPPDVGVVLLASETKPVSGRVVAVQTSNGQSTVTLELVPLDAMFRQISIKESIALADIAPSIRADVIENFTVASLGGGKYTFTLKDGKELSAASRVSTLSKGATQPLAAKEFNSGPMACKVSADGYSLSVRKVEFTLDVSKNEFDFEWNATRKAVLLTGDTTVKYGYAPKLSLAAAAKLECKLPFVEFPIPVAGALSAAASLLVPLGLGFEIEGKLPISDLAYEAKRDVTSGLRVGLECNPGCGLAHDYVEKSDVPKAEFKGPDIPESLRFEGSAFGFMFVDVNVGVPSKFGDFFEAISGQVLPQLELLESKAGIKFEAKLASELTQAEDSTYKSDYKAFYEFSIATAKHLTKVVEFLKDANTNALEFKAVSDLASSPTATITADAETFEIGDLLTFNVALKQTDFSIFGYNVADVAIKRKDIQTDGSTRLVPVGSAVARSGDTNLTITWAATEKGVTAGAFVAFVKTALYADASLELGPVDFKGLRIAIDPVASLEAATPVTLRITETDGAVSPNTEIELSASGGNVTPFSIVSNAQGVAEVTVTPVSGSTSVVLSVQARAPATGLTGHVRKEISAGDYAGTVTISFRRTVRTRIVRDAQDIEIVDSQTVGNTTQAIRGRLLESSGIGAFQLIDVGTRESSGSLIQLADRQISKPDQCNVRSITTNTTATAAELPGFLFGGFVALRSPDGRTIIAGGSRWYGEGMPTRTVVDRSSRIVREGCESMALITTTTTIGPGRVAIESSMSVEGTSVVGADGFSGSATKTDSLDSDNPGGGFEGTITGSETVTITWNFVRQ